MDVYLGSIFAFGFNWPPVGWMLCAGQILPIGGNEALYTLIGTTYGGDGVNSFALPDMRGRVPIGSGQGANLQNYPLGSTGGHAALSLTASNLPPHNHPVLQPANGTVQVPVSGTPANATSTTPGGNYLGTGGTNSGAMFAAAATQNVSMALGNTATGSTGFSQPVEIIDSYQVVNYCIATQGIFPIKP